MIKFFEEHWGEALSILAIVVALLPIIIKTIMNWFCKLHCVFLDKHLVYNVSGRIVQGNERINATGCVLIVAVNVFIYEKSFFPHQIDCELKLKNGSSILAPMFEGGISYFDTNTPPNNHVFAFDEKHNMNTNRVIEANKDNLRIMPFFLTDVNLQNFENVEKITIRLKGRLLSKRIVLRTALCVNNQFISKYDKII